MDSDPSSSKKNVELKKEVQDRKLAQVENKKPTFENLSKEDKRLISSLMDQANGFFRNRDYEAALREARKVFQTLPDYEEAKEIERYALEAIKRAQAQEEEKARKEEELRLQKKIKLLTEDIGVLMNSKDYQEAEKIFPEILAIDPENKNVKEWQSIIQEFREKKRQEETEKRIVEQIDNEAKSLLAEANGLKENNNCLSAIDKFKSVSGTGTKNAALLSEAESKLTDCQNYLSDQIEPLISEAKSLEEGSEYTEAYSLYKKASELNPMDLRGQEGINRIKDFLHEKAKILYTEAVLAESFSDFEEARRKFAECLKVAPEGDPYFGKAKRKLSRFGRFISSE